MDKEPGGYSPWVAKRVEHDLVIKQVQFCILGNSFTCLQQTILFPALPKVKNNHSGLTSIDVYFFSSKRHLEMVQQAGMLFYHCAGQDSPEKQNQ